MGNKDPRIDAYISRSADFSKPVLLHLRELVHKTCPGVQETMKWSFPHFEYKGLLCSMAAFKQHCAFGFWKAALMKDAAKLLDNRNKAMGSFGRISSLKDLPSDKIILGYVREAMKLNEEHLPSVRKKSPEKKALTIPGYFSDALKKNKAAGENFEKFSFTHKKDYLDWITEAKKEETRTKRLAQALEWMAAGKTRNWKYSQ